MERLPAFMFDGIQDTGVHIVPIGGLMVIKNFSEKEQIKQIIKKKNEGLDSSTTIEAFMQDEENFEPFVTGSNSPISENQNTLTEDYEIPEGSSAVVASGFTIADGVTLTIPDGSTLSVV